MATNFPTSIDALVNPTSVNKLNDAGVIHADQHANANDAIEALEAKVGVDSSAITTSLDYKIRNIPLSSITASTSLALGVGSIELGHATDTTIARVSAGVISVEGITVPTISSTNSLTNKILTLSAGTITAGTAPLKFTSGTNLTTAEAGAVEYDGTSLTFTPNINYGRAIVPLSVYTSGLGATLTPTATGETTAQALFPAANDTITLPIGTYYIQIMTTITRGATSTTTATARLNLAGGGTAAGTFTGNAISSVAAGGFTSQFMFSGVALTIDNVTTVTNAVASGVYNINLSGILRITTAGTLIPKYSLSAALTGATTGTAPTSSSFMTIQAFSTSGSAASTGGWA